MTQVKLKGNPVRLEGKIPQVGENAPDFTLVGGDTAQFSLKNFTGKVKTILAVPSLDTPVCAKETRLFHEKIGAMENVSLIIASGDLPFAMKRFCSTEGISNISVGSQYRDMNFSKAYGTHISDGALQGLSARAVFVVDQDDVLQYLELVEDITQEPDYDKAIAAVEKLL